MADESQAGTATAVAGANDGESSTVDSAVALAKTKMEEERIPFSVVSEKPLPRSSREVTVEVPRDVFTARLEEAFKGVRQNAVLEGFRKGKAPVALLRKRFMPHVSTEVVERMSPMIIRDYERDNDVTMYGSPVITDFKTEGDGPVTISYALEVKPDVEPKDYFDQEVEVEDLKVTDEMIDGRIQDLRDRNAAYAEDEKPFAAGDAVVLDIQGVDHKGHTVVTKTNELFENPDAKLPPTVFKALEGKKAGESIDETKGIQIDGGPDLKYTATVKAVKVLKKPELDDDFAKDLGFDDVAALRASVTAEIETVLERTRTDEAFEALMDKVISAHDFDVPPALKGQVERDMARSDYQYFTQTGTAPARLRGLNSRSQYQEELGKAAEMRVKGFLLMDAIGKKEAVQAGDADIEAALEERAAREGRKAVAIRAALERRKEFEQFTDQVRFDAIRKLLLARTTLKLVEPKPAPAATDDVPAALEGETAAE